MDNLQDKLKSDSLFIGLTGASGTGKSTLIKGIFANNPSFILASTTGISSINMGDGITTINSLFKFFDYQSLCDSFISGKLQRIIKQLSEQYSVYCIDEVSMLSGDSLDIIIEAFNQVNSEREISNKLKLLLTFDFSQLPPVNGNWAFEASNWKMFQNNIIVLDKIWRQDSLDFITALNYARDGNGRRLLELFKSLNVKFHNEVDTNYEGTMIFAKNQQVDSFNIVKLMKVNGKEVLIKKQTRGKVLGEWDKIPEFLKLKINSYVMILVNKPLGYLNNIATGFEYSNGDCGYVKDYDAVNEIFHVELIRNKQIVEIPKITRTYEIKHTPSTFDYNEADRGFGPYRSEKTGKWVIGEVEYFPLRLAFASTIHKIQGLSLDKIQFDVRNHFVSMSSMMYVALSRARTIEGLRLVCPKDELLVKRCNADVKVREFYKRLNRS